MKLRVETLPEDSTQQRLLADLDHLGQLVREGVACAQQPRRQWRAGVDGPGRVPGQCVGDYEDMGKPVSGGAPAGLVVQTWPQLLRRVVGNLVDNALPLRAAEIEPAVTRPEGYGSEFPTVARASPRTSCEAVLAPFHRLESSRNRDTGGTGLGLAIAVQLAQSLGGSLRLRNREVAG